jgi:hypothetical protein
MKLTRERVEALVKQDLATCDGQLRQQGIELSSLCKPLKAPREQSFQEMPLAGETGSFRDYWVVLEHKPDDDDGYFVLYCPRHQQYGLASKPTSDQPGYFLGHHGGLLETLKAL